MNQQPADQLSTIIAQFSGNEESIINDVQAQLANALLQQDPQSLTNQYFTFQQASPFSGYTEPLLPDLPPDESSPQENLRAFIRDTPVRTTQITGSVPDFAAGARVVKTIGPLRTIHDRIVFLDLFKVEKAIALYYQGQSLPAILFNAQFTTGPIILPNGKKVEITDKYTVIPTSVWVNAKLLCPAAPADLYCGIRVKSGTIQLSAPPQFINNQLVIGPTIQVSADLQLDTTQAPDADPGTPYGVDARAADVLLPDRFVFRFTPVSKTLQTIAPAKWKVYGQEGAFIYVNNQNTIHNANLSRLCIPLISSQQQFQVSKCQSEFMRVDGTAAVKNSWWGLSTAKLDIAHPLEADGNGSLIIECGPGLQVQWVNIGQPVLLTNPLLLAEPGRIGITDLLSNGSGASQHIELWKDELNPFGTAADLVFQKGAAFLFNTLAAGNETMVTMTNATIGADRPLKVNGEPVVVRSKNSLFALGAGKLKRTIALYDDNILWDNKLPADKVPVIEPIALALHNALFTVTPPNGASLFGEMDEKFVRVTGASLFLSFGMFSYLPILPDPYTANLGVLRQQFERRLPNDPAGKRNSTVWLWMIGRIQWVAGAENRDTVTVSFTFSPLQKPLEIEKKTYGQKPVTDQTGVHPIFLSQSGQPAESDVARVMQDVSLAQTASLATAATEPGEKIQQLAKLSIDTFTLLDVSSMANQLGIAFSAPVGDLRGGAVVVGGTAGGANASVLPFEISGMNVITAGKNAKAFALPQIAWEPIYNFTLPSPTPAPTPEDPAPTNDPPYGFNYYPNDGLATRIGNASDEPVTLAPVPLSRYLVKTYHNKKDNSTYAIFNLPFGMIAMAILNQQSNQLKKADIDLVQPAFKDNVDGGIQLELTAGSSNNIGEDNLFEGFTFQLNNVNTPSGLPANASTLGSSVTTIYNNEFFKPTTFALDSRSSVPVTRLGISGYGASMFSNWLNREAAFAQTSQAQFNVSMGRTGHEVIQVKSVIYPWGIHVVRTVTIFRLGNGYVGRVDSGWKADGDGKFDFSYNVQAYKQGSGSNPATKKKFPVDNPYTIHPGMIHGLFNIKNIREIDTKFTSDLKFPSFTYEYDNANKLIPIPTPDPPAFEQLRGLTFDADVELESVTEGGSGNRVPAKGVLGFVQLAPRGVPISVSTFTALLQSQKGSIGAPINCTIKVAGTPQRMKLNRFDVNESLDETSKPVFAGAVRGSVLLPKDGSWSMVMHTRGSGDVAPIPENYSVPLIRMGKWVKGQVVNPVDITKNLLRVAHPLDLLRAPVDDTINFGFLQNLPTQKVLFLTPAFSTAQQFLLSKTPPLLADSYRLLNSKGIFPNIGKGEGTSIGTAIQLLKGVDTNFNAKEAFADSGLLDGGKKAFQLLEIKAKEEGQKLLDQGYKLVKDKANELANKAFKFDLPAFEYPLIDVTGLKIYIEYKANSKNSGAPKDYVGKFDFNVDSFAADMADTWKGRFHNLAMVVDLGPLKRLMTIQGNFNSQKGKETDLGSKDAGDDISRTLPTPEIKFSDALEPVIKILEILSQLSQGNYAEALKKGLKVAMSNSANIWEYKFEATKDIPLVRFPPGPAYEAPQTPLKLEASMSLGVSFNAALKVTTDPKQLLPTAGAFFQFHGGLQVMCVSVAVGTIYAVGNVDLKLEADTSPKIALTMKFGFGAQISVGLPVIATVSVLFMVGVEIYADSSQKVVVTAFMLFRGHAEILGGIVGVTITIEARGSIEKAGEGKPANLKAQVTFALDISIFLIINISFSESWEEERQIA